MNKALFLDRDGIINIEKNYVHKIEDFEFIDGIFDVLTYFQKKKYLLVVITNQAGIARGLYTEDQFHILNNWMLLNFAQRNIHISKVYYCPYHPDHGIGGYKQNSFDRKPLPGMIHKAEKEFNIDLSKSILIGDKETDIEAGMAAGIKNNILFSNNENNVPTKANAVINHLLHLKEFSRD